METEQVLHMKGGSGETSYTNNSLLQRKVTMKVKPILEESVKRMMSNNITSENCWKIADLGCSSGPNALITVLDILNIIDNTNLSLSCGAQKLQLQIYLNDLFRNDFNTTFKLLPDLYQRIKRKGRENVGTCFINATPGNFYGRLFPDNFIHLFHSCYSLHWLSQAPKSKTAEPLNKGNIYITTKSPASVYEAYFEQFERDFKLFLKSRSEELTVGGIMVLTFIGREKAQEICYPAVQIGMVLNDVAQEGLVEETKLDCFNIPFYGATAEEVRQVIEAEGSFTLETLKTIKMGWDANLQEDVGDYVLDSKMRGEFIAKSLRAVYEPLLSIEFGEQIMDELFSRFAKLVSKLIELETLEYTNVVVSMTKR